MINFFTLFYLLFLFGVFVTSTFIIYHITKYSINKKSSTIMLLVFLAGLVILLIINIFIFSSIDTSEFLELAPTFNNSKSDF